MFIFFPANLCANKFRYDVKGIKVGQHFNFDYYLIIIILSFTRAKIGIAARVAPHVQMMSRLIAAPRIDNFLDRYGNAIVIYLSIDIKHNMNIETCS